MSKLRIRMSPLFSTSQSLMPPPPPPPSHKGSAALICWWSALKQTPLQPLRQKSTPLLLRILWTQQPAEQCQQSYEETLMVVTLSERRLVWVWRVRAARVRGQQQHGTLGTSGPVLGRRSWLLKIHRNDSSYSF